jgi:hypothetical protein
MIGFDAIHLQCPVMCCRCHFESLGRNRKLLNFSKGHFSYSNGPPTVSTFFLQLLQVSRGYTYSDNFPRKLFSSKNKKKTLLQIFFLFQPPSLLYRSDITLRVLYKKKFCWATFFFLKKFVTHCRQEESVGFKELVLVVYVVIQHIGRGVDEFSKFFFSTLKAGTDFV